MKIYKKIILDMKTSKVLFEDSFDYSGDVVECKGGGGDSYDEAYNARMATIAEEQQAWSGEYMDMWRNEYQPYESAQLVQNMGNLESENATYNAQLSADKSTAELGLQKTEAAKSLVGDQTAVASKFYKEALNGVDVNGAMNRATSDVSNAMAGQNEAQRQNAARMGLNPNSGRFANTSSANSLDNAKAIGLARTTARTNITETNFNRLAAASGA